MGDLIYLQNITKFFPKKNMKAISSNGFRRRKCAKIQSPFSQRNKKGCQAPMPSLKSLPVVLKNLSFHCLFQVKINKREL